MNEPHHDDSCHLFLPAARWRATRPHRGEVVYSFKVLAQAPEGGRRTVLFRRVGDGDAIEICTETDEQNLLAKLPDFLEAALAAQRLQSSSQPDDELAARLAGEAARLRFLALGQRA